MQAAAAVLPGGRAAVDINQITRPAGDVRIKRAVGHQRLTQLELVMIIEAVAFTQRFTQPPQVSPDRGFIVRITGDGPSIGAGPGRTSTAYSSHFTTRQDVDTEFSCP